MEIELENFEANCKVKSVYSSCRIFIGAKSLDSHEQRNSQISSTSTICDRNVSEKLCKGPRRESAKRNNSVRNASARKSERRKSIGIR